MNKEVVLRAEGLSKIYEDGSLKTSVLDQVHMTLYLQERMAILGPSGSGKSTLLHLLGGLDEATSGAVYLMGEKFEREANQRARLRAKYLGFVYQFHHLLPELSAMDNVAISPLIANISRQESYHRAETLLHRMGLAHRKSHKPSELSGGERQRVAIARALANHPKCILADEPTGNLDQKNAQAVWELLSELQQEGLSVSWVVVTHDESLARQFDRCARMDNGILREVGE